jgi:hypothetical protein
MIAMDKPMPDEMTLISFPRYNGHWSATRATRS